MLSMEPPTFMCSEELCLRFPSDCDFGTFNVDDLNEVSDFKAEMKKNKT